MRAKVTEKNQRLANRTFDVMLKKMNKRILVMCPYPIGTAPSQRLKFEQFFDSWRDEGYEIVFSSFISLRFMNIIYKKGYLFEKIAWTLWGYCRRIRDLFRSRMYDIIYVHLWVGPFGPALFEWLLVNINSNMIYDIDDMIMLKIHGKINVNWMFYWLKSRSRIFFLLKNAKHVITCTPYLNDFARKFNQNTTDISSTIDTDRYRPVVHELRDRAITLGWTGSHSTVRWLQLLIPTLVELRNEFRFRLLVIGDPSFVTEEIETEALAWNEATETDDLSQIDIGLYPLPDDPWVLGKSGLKAIQYMGMGIPPIAQAIGANHRVIESGVSGFLVNTKEEWKDAIRRLVNNYEERAKIGAAARRRVEERFSVRAMTPVYLEILNRVALKID